MCILIIDDTPMIISALSRILLPHYKVKVARDGEEGLKLVERFPISVILLDVNMPGISGFEVLEKLQSSEKTKSIPVIILTASDEKEDMKQAFSLGAVDYIKKPFTEEDVLRRVKLAKENVT
ncbi:MAG: response regulator [Defluviitaleaceae bacterium]|nr:response regulator [Defluviitaleaceae bacterium]MCL2262440.1 response regulator [Defluviitaleaceae bacterium]